MTLIRGREGRRRAYLHVDAEEDYRGFRVEYPGGESILFRSDNPRRDYGEAVYMARKTGLKMVESQTVRRYLGRTRQQERDQ